jgi:hypothetical protein
MRIQAAIAAAMFLIPVTVPRLTPGVLILLGLVALIWLLVAGRSSLPALGRNPVVITLFALATYLFLNSTWALDTAEAVEKSALFLAIASGTVALSAYLSRTDAALAARLARYACAGLVAGLAILLVELLFGQPIAKWTLTHFPELTHSIGKRVFVRDEHVVEIALYALNRHVTDTVILLWPALMLAASVPERLRSGVRGLLILLVALCAFSSKSQTAMVALGAGLAVFALASVSLRSARWIVVAAWVAGVSLAVPLGAMPYKLGWTSWTWLDKDSAAARFYIWSYTADKVKENPWTGIGIRSTRDLPNDRGAQTDHYEKRFKRRPGRHAHNAFLQIWLELGAIGASIVLAFGLAVLWQFARLEERTAAIGYAFFMTLCGVAAFGFGIWQTWLLAGFAVAAAAYVLGQRLGGGIPAPQAGPDG